MSDFSVDTRAVRAAAQRFQASAAASEQLASSITDPDPMMMGIFLEPLVASVGPLVSKAVRGIVTGTAGMDRAYAANLTATAASYEETEVGNADAVRAIAGELA